MPIDRGVMMPFVIAACAACGRIGFNATSSGGNGGNGDGNSGDGAIADACAQHPPQVINDTGFANGTRLLWDGSNFVAAWGDTSVSAPFPIRTRKLDRWGAPLAPALVASLGSCANNPCGQKLSLATQPTGYAIAYSDHRTSKIEVWMNGLDGNAARVGGDHQITSGTIDTDYGLIAAADTQIATVVRTSNASGTDVAVNFGFVDGTTFAGSFARVSPTPSRVFSIVLAKSNGSYGIAWWEAAGNALQFVAIDGMALPIAPVATIAAPVSTDPSIAPVGTGFALGWGDSLAIVDTTGAVSARPVLAVQDVVGVAATTTRLGVVADEYGVAIDFELLDATTLTQVGPVLHLGDGTIAAVAASDDTFLVAWLSSDGALHVTPVCP